MTLVFSYLLLMYPSTAHPLSLPDVLPPPCVLPLALLSPHLSQCGKQSSILPHVSHRPPPATPPVLMILFPHLFIVLFLKALFDLHRPIPNPLSPYDAYRSSSSSFSFSYFPFSY